MDTEALLFLGLALLALGSLLAGTARLAALIVATVLFAVGFVLVIA